MAVQAQQQQQFLECPPMLRNGGNNSGLGRSDNRGGGRAVDVYFSPQQQQQQAMAMMGRSGLANQQRGAVGFPCSPSKVLPVDLSYSLALQMDKQKQEMDQYLCLQTERLRVALQQQMKEHLVSLMRTLESKASSLLRRKEEDLARADKRAAELEEYLRRAEAEGHTWQRIARENEAMALSLRSTLEQVGENACISSPGGAFAAAGDAAAAVAVSCCDSSSSPPGPNGDRAKQEGGEQGPAETGRCRGCGSHGSCMLFMPCMHLCACKLCDTLLDSCPVCRCVKHGSIEVFFS